jgi:hypothetical protein
LLDFPHITRCYRSSAVLPKSGICPGDRVLYFETLNFEHVLHGRDLFVMADRASKADYLPELVEFWAARYNAIKEEMESLKVM